MPPPTNGSKTPNANANANARKPNPKRPKPKPKQAHNTLALSIEPRDFIPEQEGITIYVRNNPQITKWFGMRYVSTYQDLQRLVLATLNISNHAMVLYNGEEMIAEVVWPYTLRAGGVYGVLFFPYLRAVIVVKPRRRYSDMRRPQFLLRQAFPQQQEGQQAFQQAVQQQVQGHEEQQHAQQQTVQQGVQQGVQLQEQEQEQPALDDGSYVAPYGYSDFPQGGGGGFFWPPRHQCFFQPPTNLFHPPPPPPNYDTRLEFFRHPPPTQPNFSFDPDFDAIHPQPAPPLFFYPRPSGAHYPPPPPPPPVYQLPPAGGARYGPPPTPESHLAQTAIFRPPPGPTTNTRPPIPVEAAAQPSDYIFNLETSANVDVADLRRQIWYSLPDDPRAGPQSLVLTIVSPWARPTAEPGVVMMNGVHVGMYLWVGAPAFIIEVQEWL